MKELSEKLSYENDTELMLEVSAEWVDSASGAYGKAQYTAVMLYDIPATYSIVDKKLSPGEFTILKFRNLNDDQQVTIVSEIPLPATKIHEAGGNKFAFIPVDLSAKPGQFTITVIAGEEESSFKFTVNNKEFDETQIAVSHGNASYDVSKAEFDAVVKMLGEQSVGAPLWDDDKASGGTYKFVSPVAKAEYAKPAFGTRVIADTNLKASTPYIQSGLIIKAKEGEDVKATATGKVVYAGELAYCGKTIIIDHGIGVLSIYQNLSDMAVSVGDEVKIGSVIGKTGSTGYIFESGTKFYMVMDGVYINPVSNYTYGIQVS
jgi:murein DD-endopeptidase MepM/ murein hydrolase activator NlpD